MIIDCKTYDLTCIYINDKDQVIMLVIEMKISNIALNYLIGSDHRHSFNQVGVVNISTVSSSVVIFDSFNSKA